MSRIITDWKCEKCEAEFHQYISFGHPDYSFYYEWICPKCNCLNKTFVEAMPKWDSFPEVEYKDIFKFNLWECKVFQAIKEKFRKHKEAA